MGLFDAFNPDNYDGGQGLLARLMPAALFQNAPSAGLPQMAGTPNYGQTSNVNVGGYQMPQFGQAPTQDPAALPQNAMPTQGQLPPQQAPVQDSGGLGIGDRLMAGFGGLANSRGLLPALSNAIGGFATGQRMDPQGMQQQIQNMTARALLAKNVDPTIVAAAVQPGNTELLKQLVTQNFGPQTVENLGSGYIRDPRTGKITRAYEPDDKNPQSVLEYEYYRKNIQPGEQPMDYATFSTAKARAGATNISNSIDMNSGQTYDKQLAEGLGKSHASLANGVEDAQTRARDIAAMQGAVDAIQKNGGTTGGLGQQQVLDLKKTINSGMTALGVDKPFNESDLADKEFLTKFNRSMAGAQAKGAVGTRVTNFEMSNFLKANPGLDMSITGNQRLLGIQAQIEERNIAVGNAIRDATAAAISEGKKINPVSVQKIIKEYDDNHHIKDPVTGQDLTQSYALPEFQKGETNASMAKSHSENLKTMEKTIGGVTYEQRNGQWYVKK